MRTAVVILNWNTRDYLERFLPPLLGSLRGLDAAVVVADNASTDGSRELLAERFPQLRTLFFEENLGFTGGYNRAFDALLAGPDAPEYLVLLNSDIEVQDGWLEPLVDWMDTHPDYAACGPKLHALVPDGDGFRRTDRFEYAGAAGGLLDRYGFPFCRGRVLSRTETDAGQYDSPADVLWVSGACLLVRAAAWRGIGGLDGRFFAHMEEIDWCWRAWLAGWRVGVVPQSCGWRTTCPIRWGAGVPAGASGYARFWIVAQQSYICCRGSPLTPGRSGTRTASTGSSGSRRPPVPHPPQARRRGASRGA